MLVDYRFLTLFQVMRDATTVSRNLFLQIVVVLEKRSTD